MLLEASFELLDQGVAALGDLVLDREDVLPLSSLPALQLAEFVLDGGLRFECGCLARVALQLRDVRLGVAQTFLGRQQLVIGPFLELLALFVEESLIRFQQFGDARLRQTCGVGQQQLWGIIADACRLADGLDGKELFAGFLIKRLSIVEHGGKQQGFGGLEARHRQVLEREPAVLAA